MKSTNSIKEWIAVWLIESAVRVTGRLAGVSFSKVVAALVISSLILTSGLGQGMSAILDNARETKQFQKTFEDFEVPHTAGRITQGRYFGSKLVVVNIQDLHCHAEVQRNIAKILSLLDEKYKLRNVYLEGASGQVNTSWLTAIKDKNLREKVLNSLIEHGTLTGTELYSVSTNKPELILGIENQQMYQSNFKRLYTLLDEQKDITDILTDLEFYINRFKDDYYNDNQKKLERFAAKYKAGDMKARKYYMLLTKYCHKLDIDISGYRNIVSYLELTEKEKRLDYKRISLELQKFVSILKEKLPYTAYRYIVEKTDNFSKMDNLYMYLIRLSKEYKLDLSVNFKALNEFFNYVESAQDVNPLKLVKEEKKLLEVIQQRLAANASQNDCAFAVDFYRFFSKFLGNKISADDYDYFKANLPRFRLVWSQYIQNDRLSMLDSYIRLAGDFYETNLQRNEAFLNSFLANKPGLMPLGQETGVGHGGNTAAASPIEDVLKSMDNSDIRVVVTGGFHTDGITKLLEKRGISYIVITPSVTQDTRVSSEIYDKLAKEEAKIMFSTFALIPSSVLSKEEKALMLAEVMAGLREKGYTKANLIEQINKTVKNYLGENKGNFIAEETQEGYKFTYVPAAGETKVVEVDQNGQRKSTEQKINVSEIGTMSKISKGVLGAAVSAGVGIFAAVAITSGITFAMIFGAFFAPVIIFWLIASLYYNNVEGNGKRAVEKYLSLIYRLRYECTENGVVNWGLFVQGLKRCAFR